MIKEFIKSISIYGVLPVLGKFFNFLLIPIYAKMLSPELFGVLDLFDIIIFFLLILANFELTTALGRFFYEKKELVHKRIVISTGLYLTIIITSFVIAITFLFQDFILGTYIGNNIYIHEFRLSLIWLAELAINTYVSFIPRYNNKPKQYVIVSLISILTKLLASIFFVIVLKCGLKGVFYGYICGNSISILLYILISRNYVRLCFSSKYAAKMLKYTIPLLPGTLLAGLWAPILRSFMNYHFTLGVIGLFAFATRLTSINSILHGALSTAWTPLLFEKKELLSSGTNIKRISGLFSALSFLFAIFITLFSPEIAIIVGNAQYTESVIFVSFLGFSGTIKMLTQLRGFGPFIDDKTVLISISEVISIFISIGIFLSIYKICGIYSIGIATVLHELVNYIIRSLYTHKAYGIHLHYRWEIVIFLLLLLSGIFISFGASIFYRSILAIIATAITLLCLRSYLAIIFQKKKRMSKILF